MKTTNPDPVHEYLGVWWYWNETWTKRRGSYITREGAEEGYRIYSQHLEEEVEANGDQDQEQKEEECGK